MVISAWVLYSVCSASQLRALSLGTFCWQKQSFAERSFGRASSWFIIRVEVVLFLRRGGENRNKLQQNVSNC